MDSFNKLPFSKKALPKKVVFSYIIDYVIIVVLILGFYALDAVEPYHQHFSLNNYTLQYPYAEKERVSVRALVVIAVFCPAAVIAIYTLIIDGIFSHQQTGNPSGSRRRPLTGRYRLKDRLWELNCGILGLLLAVAAAFTITGALKNEIGKPKPDLISRCRPRAGSADPPVFGLSSHSICTQTDNAILKDGFRSFPSGHSSTSFAGLFYLSIYLAAKLHVLDSRGEVWKTLVVLIPTLGAALVAGSRIMDARHHPFDVVSGSLLGILVAWGSYRQYFPPVTEPWRKGRAYPIRSWGREPLPPADAVRAADEGVEPLRRKPLSTDEEQPSSSGYTGPGVSTTDPNVFRAQVSASQRRRQDDRGVFSAAAAAAAAAAAGPAPLSSTNPFVGPSTSSGRRGGPRHDRDNDGYWSSSSDSDRDDPDRDAHELQPSYTLSDPQGHGQGTYGPSAHPAAYDPVAFANDTGYHPQPPQQLASVQAYGTQRDVVSPVGSPPAAPAHAAQQAQGERRGVDLVESYSR
ncbi:phosphatidic acid phosphatase [Cryomyces antarcticus]